MPPEELSPQQTNICLHFHCADGFATPRLARMLHSLVRVSRRVGCSHLDTNNYSARSDRPPARADIRHTALQAVPRAVPKRAEATLAQWACAAGARIRDSPRSPPDCQTDGYKFSPTSRRATYPNAFVSQDQPLLAGSEQKCRGVDGGTSRGTFRFPQTRPTRPTSPETDRSHFSCIRFPPNGFAVFLTLFSKYFSPFPHGTCSLSVSCRYLALDGVYHPLWAAFPNNPTLRRQ